MELLSSTKITGFLPDEYKSLKIYLYNEVDSTNTVAKKLITEKGELPFVVIADHQTAGKGRLGRSFYSPPKTGIYMSIALGGFSSLPDAVILTPAAAVAVTDAILTLTGINAGIKWVNDIYLGNKKICGILAESQSFGDKFSVVIGIGLNMTTSDFPDELAEIADSLHCSIPREQMIAEIIKNLLNILKLPDDKAFMTKYKNRSIVLGKEIRYFQNNIESTATVIDIDDSGGLKVRTAKNEIITLTGGEITVRIMQNE